MTLLLVYATVSIFFSFLCSILEAVLLSVSSTYINLKKKEGFAYASILEELKKDVDKPLIAILTLNTIAHTVGAILVGVQAEQLPYKIELLGIYEKETKIKRFNYDDATPTVKDATWNMILKLFKMMALKLLLRLQLQ